MRSIAIILFLLSNQAICQVQGTWSGTMSYEVKANTVTGVSRKTYKINILDNRVTGSMSGIDSTIIEGKLYEVESCKDLGGLGELITVWIFEDSHYEINILSPEFACTKYEGGYGDPGRANLAVETDFPTKSRKVLTGSHSETRDLAGLGTQSTTISWNLYSSPDAVLIISPDNYDTWLPEPGENELTKGSTIKINLKLQGVNGQPLKVKAEKFELRLSKTSQEPGITLNMPLEPKVDLPDLRFAVQSNCTMLDKFQGIDITCKACTNTSATLDCYDGGAYTTLTAYAVLEGGERIQGMLLLPGGITEVPIPKRDPKSNIASAWLVKHGNPADKDDEEQLPGNQNKGDGLTAYEEYRGVISEDTFMRLDPQKLELGVRYKKTDKPVFSNGIRWFEKATPITAIRFFDNEIKETRELNNNNKTSHLYLQFVEKLENGPVTDAVGENVPVTKIQKIPKESEQVVIDVNQIRIEYQKQLTALNIANAKYKTNYRIPYTVDDNIANTVAHELAHGINVNHHGELSNETSPVTIIAGTYSHAYDDKGNEITDPKFTVAGNIGLAHNDESGDLTCIMAYTSYYQWVKLLNNFGSYDYYAIKLLPPGKTLCSSKNDNNPNSLNYNGKYFGDATFGNCIEQIRFK